MPNSKNVSPMNSATSTESVNFRPWHFFVILTLIAATVGVLTARKTSPENLVMLSLTVFAAGAASIAMYRMLIPLVGKERALRAETLGHRARAALEREKALVLRSIKELEFDRAMGKLAEEDFEEMSHRLRARAIGLMRQLDASHAAPRERIERELADRVARESQQQRRPVRGAAGSQSQRARVICDACDASNDVDARFCKSCGTKLARAHA
jgi:ribosomal protein L40E